MRLLRLLPVAGVLAVALCARPTPVAAEASVPAPTIVQATSAQGGGGGPFDRARSAVGLVALLTVGWLLGTDRSRVSWRVVLGGVGLQVLFGFLVLRTPLGIAFFDGVNGAVRAVLGFAEQGGRFVFGNLVSDNVPVGTGEAGQGPFSPTAGLVARSGAFFAFRILPNIIFVSTLMTVLYHLGVMQLVVRGAARIMQRTLRLSGAETLCSASNIFVGLMESPLVVKPYIERMTDSELMAVMTAGMATISGGVLAAYAGMMLPYEPRAAGHLIAASIMSAPGALVLAKLMVPETAIPETGGTEVRPVERPDVNTIDAAARGAAEGLRLALLVGAMLIAFIGLVSMLDAGVGWAGGLVGRPGSTLEGMLGVVLAPVAWLLGVPWGEAAMVGELIGVEAVLNEFVAFVRLEELLRAGAGPSGHALVVTIYALASFANFGSVAMTLAGLGALAPSRRHDLARLGLRAMAAGLLAALSTAAVAGMLA